MEGRGRLNGSGPGPADQGRGRRCGGHHGGSQISLLVYVEQIFRGYVHRSTLPLSIQGECLYGKAEQTRESMAF